MVCEMSCRERVRSMRSVFHGLIFRKVYFLVVSMICFGVFAGCLNSESGSRDSGSQLHTPARANLALSAAKNKDAFDQAIKSIFVLHKKDELPSPIELAASLVRAGFSKKSIQVTNNRTTLGAYAYSMSVSVFLHNSCLVGQFIRSTGEYSSSILDPVGTTQLCLVGKLWI